MVDVYKRQEILSPLGYEIISMKDSGIDIDIEENGKTFKENAGIKARAIYEISHTAVSYTHLRFYVKTHRLNARQNRP